MGFTLEGSRNRRPRHTKRSRIHCGRSRSRQSSPLCSRLRTEVCNRPLPDLIVRPAWIVTIGSPVVPCGEVAKCRRDPSLIHQLNALLESVDVPRPCAVVGDDDAQMDRAHDFVCRHIRPVHFTEPERCNTNVPLRRSCRNLIIRGGPSADGRARVCFRNVWLASTGSMGVGIEDVLSVPAESRRLILADDGFSQGRTPRFGDSQATRRQGSCGTGYRPNDSTMEESSPGPCPPIT